MEDDGQQGIQIAYANQASVTPTGVEGSQDSSTALGMTPAKPGLSLSFPKTLDQPLEIKLDEQRIITLTDQNNHDLKPELLSDTSVTPSGVEGSSSAWQRFLDKLGMTEKEDDKSTYLSYQNQRKTILYTLKKDQATNEKQLKSWTLYQSGNGIEHEAYRIDHAQVKINEEGQVELFYQGEQELKNQQAQTEVEPSLLERAQRTLEKEMGEDILNSNQAPDLIIPKPFFYDKDGEKHEAEWRIESVTPTGAEGSQDSSTLLGMTSVILSLELTFKDDLYPIALDPTLQFTAPAQSNTGEVITGEVSSLFGTSLTTGDLNADGKTDLIVGAEGYSTNTGRAYIFYNDGSIPTTAATADVTITGGATSNFFGHSLTTGDLNADGKTDLAVGAYGYSTNTGRAYIFYNDGSIPTTAATADVIITGQSTNNSFGISLTTGDLNADGKTDLVVGAWGYSTSTGRAYIFYNDGSIPTTAATADVIITGQSTINLFGVSLTTGDFNADGTTDLVVGASEYSTNTGRAYIFYNDGSIPTTAATADVTITGEATNNYFGVSLTTGDLNADGKTDLAVGASAYSTSTGRAYIFYNDGSIPTTAATADVVITGETTSNYFGYSLTTGDLNADGKTDLAIGAYGYSTNTGRAYIFYNDGSIPTTAATADVIITGETGGYFERSVVATDFNADGKTDLIVGAYGYSTNTGRVYIFYSQNGQVNTNKSIVGETTTNYFGSAMATGDFNADGKTDLAIGASGYSTDTGRAYIFYNDGSIPTTAATADVIITGETTNNYFGVSLTTGDLNADGKTDLAIGASGYSTDTGRAYIFYNDGSIPTTAATADVIITGEATNNSFGYSLTTGDLNADGKTDLAAGAYGYSSDTGRAYIFYNDGSIPTTAATADVIITGEATGDYFGATLTVGDLNADGKTDLAAGAYGYSSDTGRAYIFYNDGSIPTTAATADVIITGEASSLFGAALTTGDLNADGKTDLAVGAYGYSTLTGRAYIFYNDGSIPTTAATADVIITGGATSDAFGHSLAAGDLNADGKTDLAVGAYGYSTYTGRAYIFYNDGSIPTTAATADVTITGEATNNSFGVSLVAGDLNADGRTDLLVGATGASSDAGKIYFYETRENFTWQLQSTSLVSGLRVNPNVSGQELKITGEATDDFFGSSVVIGDFNADGKTDLAVGADGYSFNTGRAYIFYNDGSLTSSASSADVVITGEATDNYFGVALTAGDLNADGKTDLAVGAHGYSTNTGRAYIFYNDGSIPTTAATADVIITGEATGDNFGVSLTAGDLNADGKTDLAVGAHGYSTNTGRAYIFYNDGSIPTTAATADVTITGETTNNYFGVSLTTGDLNADGKTDLAVGAHGYSTNTGRAYIFYNDGSIPTTAATADVIITGETTNNYFGISLTTGDLNADGKTDLIVGAEGYSTNTGRAYIFYNDGSIPTTAATADVTITGEATGDYFGATLTVGDLNADGKTDLAVGAHGYSTYTGRAYLFYNDGSIPTTAATADVAITGTGGSFGVSLTVGDLNADGKTDLAVGAHQYASDKGRVYLYTWNDGVVTGEASSNYFAESIVSGDFNADGKIDLAIGASAYSTNTGRAYIFYNDGSIPTTAATADVIITGETTNNYFGISLTTGDLNADGKTDLAVGASAYSTNTGRAYIFYNDGSIPTTAATADVTITGETTNNYFGVSLTTGDLNADGK
ncbi:MAG: FG-GAP repeat protein, partial [Candidatus Moranbacteria bacterium]|nr:FG-GAP repeat protein [Candidatus Moranbacteria bacterium]